MTIEATIQTALAALVSGRCYPLTAPDPVVKPYIVFSIITKVNENDLGGLSGLSNYRVQVDPYATSYGAVKVLSDSAESAMTGLGAISLSSQELFESDTQLYRITMDFSIWA
jgi:hypothetical protein